MADQIFNVECGFFDSVNGDRLYTANDMNRPYKRIIANGVFATPSGTPSTDLQDQSPEAPEAEIYRAIAAIAEKVGELIGAMADFAAAFLKSDAFAELCAQIANYQPPTTPRPPKTIDPTVHPPMQRIIPRARSQLRGTKRR